MISEEQRFKTEDPTTRAAIAETLVAAEAIEAGTVMPEGGTTETSASIPNEPTFEVELERVTDAEAGEQRYELAWIE